MNGVNQNKRKLMQDEMSRFEAEIYSSIAESARTGTNLLQATQNYVSGKKTISSDQYSNSSATTEQKTIISAPAQISETKAKLNNIPAVDDFTDVDDDVTRALLAAAAGVTYSNPPAPSTTKSTTKKPVSVPSISKPPAPPQPKPLPQPQQHIAPTAHYMIPNLNQPPPMLTSVASSTMSVDFARLQAKNKVVDEEPTKKKKFLRLAAGKVWNDESLNEWDPNDFRIFCGDLGPEVTDETLIKVFNRFSSFKKAKVIRDKRTNKSKGYGFVSFDDPEDFTKAMREVNGKYVGSRPIKLRRSDWKSRQLETQKKKEKEKKKLGLKL